MSQTEAFNYLNSKTGETALRGDLGVGVHAGGGVGNKNQGKYAGISGDGKVNSSGSRSSKETSDYQIKIQNVN